MELCCRLESITLRLFIHKELVSAPFPFAASWDQNLEKHFQTVDRRPALEKLFFLVQKDERRRGEPFNHFQISNSAKTEPELTAAHAPFCPSQRDIHTDDDEEGTREGNEDDGCFVFLLSFSSSSNLVLSFHICEMKTNKERGTEEKSPVANWE